jgi:hypothetical protein
VTYAEAKASYERAPKGYKLTRYKALQDALHEQLRQEVGVTFKVYMGHTVLPPDRYCSKCGLLCNNLWCGDEANCPDAPRAGKKLAAHYAVTE